MKYILIALLLLPAFAQAGDLILGQYTYHFHVQKNLKKPFKREHPLLGYSSEKYTFIAMENSYEEFSVVLLRTAKFDLTENFRGALSAGLATGYEDAPYDMNLGGVIAVGYVSLDIHPRADKYGLLINFAHDEFIGAGLRFTF